MDLIRLIYTILLIASLLCAGILILYAYRRRTMPGAKYFIFLLLSALVYNGGYIGELNAPGRDRAIFWFHFEHLAIPIQHYLWAVMSLELARISRRHLRNSKIVLLFYPAMYYILYFTNRFHHLYILKFSYEYNGFFNVLQTVKGPAFTAVVIAGTILAACCFFAYFRAYGRASRLHRYGYLIMIGASLLPWIAVYLTAAPTNALGLDYFPMFSSVSGIFYLIGIFQYKIFQVIPIATDMVYRHAREGILLIDQTDRIIEANLLMTDLFPELKSLKKRRSFSSFVGAHSELGAVAEGEKTARFQLKDGNEERHYTAQITDILTDDNLGIGKMLTVRDISPFVEHQKQLALIADSAISKAEISEISFLQAQIKPHFLNNTLSVIQSMITVDPEKAKELIGDLGEYLVRSCCFDSETDIVPLADELETIRLFVAIERARFGDRVTYLLECDPVPDVLIPRLALQPLVENAIRHGILKKAGGGTVTLQIQSDVCGVSFCVKDDGVGMTREKAASLLSADRGRGGLGVCNVNRRLMMHYGQGLRIVSEPGGGTEVSFGLSLHDAV